MRQKFRETERKGNKEVKITFKNARKFRSLGKQREAVEFLRKEQIDICGLSETNLNDKQEVDGDRDYIWFGKGAKIEEGRRGGVGFLIRKHLKTEVMKKHECEDLLAVKIKGARCLVIVVVYQKCEGEDVAANKRRMKRVTELAKEAERNGDIFVVGGDFNGHLLELDGCQNVNGDIVKTLAEERELDILNLSWPGMNRPTWSGGGREFALDLILLNNKGREEVLEGWIGGYQDVVESDHCVIAMRMTWQTERRVPKPGKKRRKVVPKENWTLFGQAVEEELEAGGREEIQTVMTRAVKQFEVDPPRRQRRDWWDAEVEEAIRERKEWNQEHRRRGKIDGRQSETTREAWNTYQKKKKKAAETVAEKIKEWSKKKMEDLGRGHERSKNMFRELNRHMGKSKRLSSLEEVIDSTGQTTRKREEMEKAIVETWEKLLNTEGEAQMGEDKVGHQMVEPEDITTEEVEKALKHIRLGKAVDEEGVSGEMLKALRGRSREELRRSLNRVLNGGEVPADWRRSRVVLIHKGGERKNLKNYRPVAISSLLYKVFMTIVRDRMEEWMREGDILNDLQGGFRKGRRTDDNLYMLGQVKDLAEARGQRLLVGCLDLEKAYDRVNREKLMEVLEKVGLHEKWLRVLREVYRENKVRFVLGDLETGWVPCTSGVRQGCPLSPLLFNIYMRDVAAVLKEHPCGVKVKTGMEGEGGERERRIGGLLYADDIILLANSTVGMKGLLETTLQVFKEYGMRLSETKSKVVELVGEVQEEEWVVDGLKVMKSAEVQYLGLKLQARGGGILQFSENLKKVGSLVGMTKYASKRSGSRFVIGREAWKSMVVGRMIYGVAAVGWTAAERRKVENLQMDFGRWLWRAGRWVRNVVIHGETGWSTFWEREAKVRATFINRVLDGNGVVSEVGRGCVEEIGVKSRWWRGVVNLGRKLGVDALMKMVWKKKMTWGGIQSLGITERDMEKIRKKALVRRIQEDARQEWRQKVGDENNRLRGYGEWKRDMKMERYADGSDGARVRMMCRGDSLPVRSNHIVHWKYREGDRLCLCGEEEKERHVLLECIQYEDQREEWIRRWRAEKNELDPMEGVLGFTKLEKGLEKSVLRGVGAVWRERERREQGRLT